MEYFDFQINHWITPEDAGCVARYVVEFEPVADGRNGVGGFNWFPEKQDAEEYFEKCIESEKDDDFEGHYHMLHREYVLRDWTPEEVTEYLDHKLITHGFKQPYKVWHPELSE